MPSSERSFALVKNASGTLTLYLPLDVLGLDDAYFSLALPGRWRRSVVARVVPVLAHFTNAAEVFKLDEDGRKLGDYTTAFQQRATWYNK